MSSIYHRYSKNRVKQRKGYIIRAIINHNYILQEDGVDEPHPIYIWVGMHIVMHMIYYTCLYIYSQTTIKSGNCKNKAV